LVLEIHKGGFTYCVKMALQSEVIRTVCVSCSFAQQQSGSQVVKCQAPML